MQVDELLDNARIQMGRTLTWRTIRWTALDWLTQLVSEQHRIFERFERGSNVLGQFSGMGTGQASARNIVESHGGTIEVQSDQGSGSSSMIRRPMLVTADVVLAVLSGQGVAASLRGFRGTRFPVLVITADSHASEKARQLNAFCIVAKAVRKNSPARNGMRDRARRPLFCVEMRAPRASPGGHSFHGLDNQVQISICRPSVAISMSTSA